MTPTFPQSCARILAHARQIAETVTTWADFSNAIFSPSGIVAEVFPDMEERREFLFTAEYHEIKAILDRLTDKFGLVEGATPAGRAK